MTTDLDRALIAMRVSRDHGHGAVLNDAEVPALLAEIDRLTRERDDLRRQLDEARAERDALAKALAELVACKALKDAGLRSPEDEDAYFRRKPAAWAAARAALAQIEQERSEQAKDAEARSEDSR